MSTSVQKQRSVRLLVPVNGDGKHGYIRITVEGKCTDYYLDRKGAVYILERVDNGDRYTVDPRVQTCTCKGFQRWTTCKHPSAVCTLIQQNKI